MSLLGMPWATINLGCEMVYILHQRLNAQGIPSDKSVKVLQDIIRTMFEPGFLADKLFVAQDMYSLSSTRKVFDKIAHSSIMKLSENSMDKLFDLMVMGAKFCLLCSTHLENMLQVTLRHLNTVQSIITAAAAACNPPCVVDTAVLKLLRNAGEATNRFYGGLCTGDLALLRSTLARYFQDKRVRVSLFLAEGIQLQSGKLVMPSCIHNRVGLVRSFAADGSLESEEKLQLASQAVDPNEFFCHPVPLGDNLYSKDRPKVVPPPRAADTGMQDKKEQTEQTAQEPVTHSGSHGGRYAQQQASGGNKRAARELDFLAHLVHVAKPGAADNFKLNLFEDGDGLEVQQQPLQTSSSKPSTQKHQELQFGLDGRNDGYIKALGSVLEAVQLEDNDNGSKPVGEDLLELMDSVV